MQSRYFRLSCSVTVAVRPLDAPVGTVAVICVSLVTPKLTGVPLNLTALAPLRLLPVRMTLAPAGPLVGLNDVSVGAGVVTVKLALVVAVPPGVVTLIGP